MYEHNCSGKSMHGVLWTSHTKARRTKKIKSILDNIIMHSDCVVCLIGICFAKNLSLSFHLVEVNMISCNVPPGDGDDHVCSGEGKRQCSMLQFSPHLPHTNNKVHTTLLYKNELWNHSISWAWHFVVGQNWKCSLTLEFMDFKLYVILLMWMSIYMGF